ncbi:zinc-binding dehydrogenase [Acidisoma sp. S159]|uniref:zinc-dependent alcohol dehydrogenase n=1 Tax=Acidisoma sp. S159 TaxID=1747225 RepID=UPI00131E581B|nr:alcohol dehydrogenase catalytic domain-containing protein [Acidisoma sp. S159]
MKAVVLSNERKPELRDIPYPSPKEGEVLLEVDHCGICGSDLHAATSSIYRTGIVMGHEFSGKIVQAAHDVAGWKIGDRVCVNPNGAYCGHCFSCRNGQVNLCPQILTNSVGAATPGGMAEFVAVNARTIHLLPAGMSGKQGSWVEPMAVAMRAVRRSLIQIGDDAIVYGAGPIGLLVIAVLRKAGAGLITVIEPSAFRRNVAVIAGADRALSPDDIGLSEAFREPVDGPGFAFDCVGSPTVVDAAVRVLRPHGRLTIIGLAQTPNSFRATDLIFKEIDICGSFIYADEFQQAIRLIASGGMAVDRFTTAVRPLDEAINAFSDLSNAAQSVKILLTPHARA